MISVIIRFFVEKADSSRIQILKKRKASLIGVNKCVPNQIGLKIVMKAKIRETTKIET